MTGTLEVTINLCVIIHFIKHERSARFYYTDLQVVSVSLFICLPLGDYLTTGLMKACTKPETSTGN